MEKFKISLEGIELYGRHGLYPGEKELGARYRIEVSFDVELSEKEHYQLEDLVDYKKAYDIITQAFHEPTQLLENLCKTISNKLKNAFPNANAVNIAISKLSPPLGGICLAAKVEYSTK